MGQIDHLRYLVFLKTKDGKKFGCSICLHLGIEAQETRSQKCSILVELGQSTSLPNRQSYQLNLFEGFLSTYSNLETLHVTPFFLCRLYCQQDFSNYFQESFLS